MFKKTVIDHFGSIAEVARVLEISHSAVCQWRSLIPEKNALIIQEITNGELKYDASLYPKSRRAMHAAQPKKP